MKGFIGWLRSQPQYADLANDAPAAGSFKGLLQEMFTHNACDAAWSMLYDAARSWPGSLPQGWTRDIFNGQVPSHVLSGALYHYAHSSNMLLPKMRDNDFEAALKSVQLLWGLATEHAEEAIELQPCSPVQLCRLWAAKGAQNA